MLLKLTDVVALDNRHADNNANTRCQFRQSFTRAFFVQKFVQSQTLSREKTFVQKNAHIKCWWNWHQPNRKPPISFQFYRTGMWVENILLSLESFSTKEVDRSRNDSVCCIFTPLKKNFIENFNFAKNFQHKRKSIIEWQLS